MIAFEDVCRMAGSYVTPDIDLKQPVHIIDEFEIPQMVNPDFNGEIVWFSREYKFFTTDKQGYGEVYNGRSYPRHVQIVNGVYEDE